MKKITYAITQKYQGTFKEAVDSITQALGAEGFGILTTIDVAKTLKKKLDIEYSPYIILGACNPLNAYKALQAEKEIGLLLPCNVIVYEENNSVYISIIKPTSALTLSNNTNVARIAKDVEEKLKKALEKTVNKN